MDDPPRARWQRRRLRGARPAFDWRAAAHACQTSSMVSLVGFTALRALVVRTDNPESSITSNTYSEGCLGTWLPMS